MSCYPYPRETDIESIRIPLIAQTQYSFTGQTNFEELFERALYAKLQKIKATDSDRQESTDFSLNHSLASVIQPWVFFGIASKALGRNIIYEEFADADPDGPHLFTDLRIPEWFFRELKARWDEPDDSLTAGEVGAMKAELQKFRESALRFVIYMDLLADDLNDDKLIGVLLSIHMLLCIVAHVLDSDTLMITSTTASSASTNFLKRRMIKNGWCEKRLNFLDASPMSYPALYFLSSLKPPRVNAEDHSSCSSKRCLVMSKLNRPSHRTDECLCEDVVVPVERVNTIVAAGGIPLVRITRSSLGKIELVVVPYTSSFRFVAISHVWADQQFGSAQNSLPKCQVACLEETLSSLPISTDHWAIRELARWWPTGLGDIVPPSHAHEYFWLDSFCIPQAVEHANLRSRAIESMNLIYAAATHTLVFDQGLQALDAGRCPSSLANGGRPTYYSPQDENLLDVVAYLYASNWMGRAWTLQEGILSRDIIFPLHGSLAFHKLLRPHRSKPEIKINKRLRDETEPFREPLRRELFKHLMKSLHVEEYKEYARTPADRAARFVKAHSLLRSRTTTQAEDIPLILMNMSCMNANDISQSKTIDLRMKRLFYGLESLPTELLFSHCTRLGHCTLDAWIPREIVPENFEGKHTLKLGPAGFTFTTRKGAQALQFYLLSPAHRFDRFRLLLPDQKHVKGRRFNAEALQSFDDQQLAAPTSAWCIVVNNEQPERGARFTVTKIVGDRHFLHFDCPLRLTEIEDSKSASDAQRDPQHECGAVRLHGDFILERNYETQDLSISRPQNAEQYSDRLVVINLAICDILVWGEGRLMRAIWGDENAMSTLFYILYGLYTVKRQQWIVQASHAFVHQAWMATYQPDWDPKGPWKWFWKLSNWEPPIPFSTLNKWFYSSAFFLNFQAKDWYGMARITLLWMPLYPTRELVNMYLTVVFTTLIFSFFF